MNKLAILFLFVLSLLNPAANAQLDKQHQEQDRLGDIEKAKCVRLHDLAQHSGFNGHYYNDHEQQVILIRTLKHESDIIFFRISTLGTLNVEDERLLKLEEDFLVKYSHWLGDIERKILGR